MQCIDQGGAGDDLLKAQPLLNLNGSENPIGLPILQMLQSSQAHKRYSNPTLITISTTYKSGVLTTGRACLHCFRAPCKHCWRKRSIFAVICYILRRLACRHIPAYAPALLRLCSVIDLRECMTLEAITAILGCPVWLPALGASEQPDAAKLAPSQQRILCQALWHSVDWLREVVNSFSADTQG